MAPEVELLPLWTFTFTPVKMKSLPTTLTLASLVSRGVMRFPSEVSAVVRALASEVSAAVRALVSLARSVPSEAIWSERAMSAEARVLT